MDNSKPIKEHLANFNIAGFTYYDGAEAFPELKMGLELNIAIEDENKFDARAVLISYKNWKLGYVPREHNRIFYKLLKVGMENIKVRVQGLDKSGHPEGQVRVVAHLVGD
ncbi:MAG TPA: HIRAN domain-containing protein [Flavobacteriaceae bacterium]|nr:HIRAN domain-containing protein [Flavobacteriaceae bacterium]